MRTASFTRSTLRQGRTSSRAGCREWHPPVPEGQVPPPVGKSTCHGPLPFRPALVARPISPRCARRRAWTLAQRTGAGLDCRLTVRQGILQQGFALCLGLEWGVAALCRGLLAAFLHQRSPCIENGAPGPARPHCEASALRMRRDIDSTLFSGQKEVALACVLRRGVARGRGGWFCCSCAPVNA